ncbi:MAG: serine/threonine-protein kinase [Gemmatimonadales bacterium]
MTGRVIGRLPATTPTGFRSVTETVHDIPEDLLREAAHRLGIISLLGVVLWTLGGGLAHVAMRAMDDPAWSRMLTTDWIVVVGIVASFGLYLYSRRSRRSPRFLLDLGLVYLIATALEIGLLWHWSDLPTVRRVEPVFTWVGPLLLMFAAIIPNSPRKTLVASFIAASMNPLGMLIAKSRGIWDFGGFENVLVMHYPDYILVGVAVVISAVVTRLGQHVTRAREMGSYHIGELLSRGGMGEIYRATHRMLARPAAIKLIRPEILSGGNAELAELTLRRFRREAEVAASLRSPHTVELYDFGVTEDQSLYFVMELLEGMDLQQLVARHGAQPANRVIHILRQVCESLEEAHARGLVHRDIKPPNIFLGRLGLRHDFVKVLDFGLVKPVAGKGVEQSLGTAADVTPGTPAYMAPEIATSEQIDGRADLYALGCVAFFLLTGRVVFESTTVLQAVARHLSDTPSPPSQRAGHPVPAALDRIVLTLLAKQPEDRPAGAAELDRALAAVDVEPWTEEMAAAWWAGKAFDSARQPGAGAEAASAR